MVLIRRVGSGTTQSRAGWSPIRPGSSPHRTPRHVKKGAPTRLWAVARWRTFPPQPETRAVGPAPRFSSPVVRFGHGPTGSFQTGATTLLAPGAFCTDSWLFGLPVVSAMLANRAGRAGSSRAAKTAAHQPKRDGPDLTRPAGVIPSVDGTAGSPNANPSSVVRRRAKQGRRPKGPGRRPEAGRGASSRSEALSGGAAGGPALHGL